jgi:hypothetical protein
MIFDPKDTGFTAATIDDEFDSHDGTKNEFVWSGALNASESPQELLRQASEQLAGLMWSFGIADASLMIRRAQRAAFGQELIPMTAAEQEHESKMAQFYGEVRSKPGNVAPSEPMPLLTADARMVGPDEGRRLGLTESNTTRLVIFVTNAGRGPATDVVVSFEGFTDDGGGDHYIGAVGAGATAMRAYYCPRHSAGAVPTGSVPEVIQLRYDGLGWSGGIYRLQRAPGSHPPTWGSAVSTKPTTI